MSKTQPKISVILPSYNHALFLEKRIDSILAQTYQDFELIILDDNSTDNSREIIDRYSTNLKVSHIIYNEVNSGSTFVQWQRGFALAQGEYIWIAESDDYAGITFLEKLAPLLENDLKCSVVFSQSYIIGGDGEILSEDWDRTRAKNNSISYFDGTAFIKARMLFNNSIYNASMVLFRKSTLSYINSQYADFKYCGDWMFWTDVCLHGNVVRYNEKLNYFRQHTQKVTPRAESQGSRFVEGKYVLQYMMDSLQLTSSQRKVVVGRFLKRLVSHQKFESKELKKKVLQEVTTFFSINKSSIFIYELDKRFDFSKLGVQKNRYL